MRARGMDAGMDVPGGASEAAWTVLRAGIARRQIDSMRETLRMGRSTPQSAWTCLVGRPARHPIDPLRVYARAQGELDRPTDPRLGTNASARVFRTNAE